jgi:hypothetical protein
MAFPIPGVNVWPDELFLAHVIALSMIHLYQAVEGTAIGHTLFLSNNNLPFYGKAH